MIRAYTLPLLLTVAVLFGLVRSLASDGLADLLGVGLAALPLAVMAERWRRSRGR